ncbi:MAG: hypothetical protein KF745_09470 [Phycisphaeraceae bacterium]|nr:hypothetical protein [Phycisphaeraceae bacterium]
MTARKSIPLIALPVLALAALLSGCVGYTSAPATREESVFADPNAPATRDVATKALRWTAYRYPPEGGDGRTQGWDQKQSDLKASGEKLPPRFAINLPPTTRPETYRRVVEDVGLGAVMLTPETQGLPTYYLGRVYILGDQASVDVIRPVAEFSNPEKVTYQAITVRLRGGLKPWTVISNTPWTLGSVTPPAPNFYVPEPEPTLQYASPASTEEPPAPEAVPEEMGEPAPTPVADPTPTWEPSDEALHDASNG